MVLPAAFFNVQELTSLAGGLAAAIAIGAFIGQARSGFVRTTAQERRRDIAVGGFFGLVALIGLFLASGK